MLDQKQIPEFNDEDKRESSFHDFDAEPEIIGKLKEITTGQFEEMSEQYTLETQDGEKIVGSYSVLKGKLRKDDVGKWVKIVYLGEKVSPKTKRKYKDFEIFIKD